MVSDCHDLYILATLGRWITYQVIRFLSIAPIPELADDIRTNSLVRPIHRAFYREKSIQRKSSLEDFSQQIENQISNHWQVVWDTNGSVKHSIRISWKISTTKPRRSSTFKGGGMTRISFSPRKISFAYNGVIIYRQTPLKSSKHTGLTAKPV